MGYTHEVAMREMREAKMAPSCNTDTTDMATLADGDAISCWGLPKVPRVLLDNVLLYGFGSDTLDA